MSSNKSSIENFLITYGKVYNSMLTDALGCCDVASLMQVLKKNLDGTPYHHQTALLVIQAYFRCMAVATTIKDFLPEYRWVMAMQPQIATFQTSSSFELDSKPLVLMGTRPHRKRQYDLAERLAKMLENYQDVMDMIFKYHGIPEVTGDDYFRRENLNLVIRTLYDYRESITFTLNRACARNTGFMFGHIQTIDYRLQIHNGAQ